MANPRHMISKTSSSVPTEGEARGRKLRLKAANDNRPPLSVQIKQFLFLAAPVSVILFFGAVWFFS